MKLISRARVLKILENNPRLRKAIEALPSVSGDAPKSDGLTRDNRELRRAARAEALDP